VCANKRRSSSVLRRRERGRTSVPAQDAKKPDISLLAREEGRRVLGEEEEGCLRYISVSRVPAVRNAYISGLCACSRARVMMDLGGRRASAYAKRQQRAHRCRACAPWGSQQLEVRRPSRVHLFGGTCPCAAVAELGGSTTAKWRRPWGERRRTAISFLQPAAKPTRRVKEP
jgi:hypothetical protein